MCLLGINAAFHDPAAAAHDLAAAVAVDGKVVAVAEEKRLSFVTNPVDWDAVADAIRGLVNDPLRSRRQARPPSPRPWTGIRPPLPA